MTKCTILLSLLAAGTAHAANCEFERQIEERLDVSGSEDLQVVAGAGDLKITGRDGLEQMTVRARVCASEESLAEGAHLELIGGKNASAAVVLPEVDWDLSWSGSRYLYMDLEIDVPANLPLSVRDSSGDIDIENIESAIVRDSSGDIDIDGVAGDVVLEDSSGDIEVVRVKGNVTVNHDSSGDIYGSDIEGSVLVAKDSSGDIRFRDVGRDFTVERDSSGDIVARGVGGDFRVLKDSSGDIESSDVSGKVSVPDKG